MKCLLILSALLIGMKGILGHSIMKLGIQNETKGDIYEIKEDKETNTITFANPKVEKPTLREIVYYHMIERPYGQEDKESPEFDDTMRPFTNSHGFPFLESVEKEADVIEDANKEDSTEMKDVIVDETPIEDDAVEVIYYYDEDEAFKNPIEFEEREIPTTHAPEEVTKFDAFKTTVLQKISEEENEETTTQVPVTTVTAEPVFEKKAKSTRKLLFDRVKEKYYSKNETQSSPPSERRKREISMVSSSTK
ncbi:uncharacterized protein LOC114366285 [Ostrinia furnacalis]|uniref:uncharacterized protein LOC114366285 n=1 Tax=Ostrinia furnacalis TaxID=93504 RepID=UPI001038B609|nr:uncharacterized protein LOC114366285 [Ostrinia furnacalis]